MVLFQILMGAITTIFILAISTSKQLELFFYTHFLMRILLVIILIIIYYGLGKLLKKSISGFAILGSLLLPIGIGVLCAFIAYMGLGSSLYTSGISTSLWRLPLDLYTMPQTFALTLLDLDLNFEILVIQIVAPSLIMIISLLVSKLKFKLIKRKRRKNVLEE